MPETQTFSLATVLSITTGRLLCPIEDVYAILNHMTRDSLYTHQLPRAMRECAPWLLRWVPDLATVDTTPLDMLIADQGPQAGCQHYVQGLQHAGMPETYDVSQIPADDHTYCDPVGELESLMGKNRVFILGVGDDEL